MKKITLSAFTFIVITSALILSCQKPIKETNFYPPKKHSISSIKNYYNSPTIESNDKSINFVSGKKTRKLTGKQATKLIVEDVKGGITGGGFGSLGGPLGAMGGAVIGAVVSSAYTWWQDGWDWGKKPVILVQESKSFAFGYTNNNEFIGYLHNKYCKQLFNSDVINSNNYQEFAQKFLLNYLIPIQNEIGVNVPFNVNSPEIISIIDESYQATIGDDYTSTKTFFENRLNINVDVKNILLSLFERMYQISDNDYGLIYSYTNEYIHLVNNDSNLNATQKNTLLNSLNILKYSASLWEHN
jgi:hypothetical protein